MDKEIIVESKGDLKTAKIELNALDIKLPDEKVNSLYSHEYLSKMVADKNHDFVTISLASGYPMQIKYAGEKHMLTYLLAPRADWNE